MPNRVNVNITARDLTRGELARLRRNFGHLGEDINRAVGARTRQNFDRLRQSVNQSRRDLRALRGAIPDDEFIRMDNALQRAQRRMQRGFGQVGQRAFARVVADLRDVEGAFRRLDDSAQIRVRTDLSALRRADAQLNAWRRQQSRRAVRVRIDPERRGFGRRLTSFLTAPVRQSGRVLGGILSDGLGQGIIAGFKGAGPIGIAVFAGILAGAVSVIGAALSGLLVTALGLAFVGIAGISAAQSDEVQRNWAKALDKLKGHFKEVGEPLIPVLHEAVHQLEDLADRVAPKFREAMVEAAPAVEEFIDKLFEGFERFGEAAFTPIMDAFEVFSPVFGEVFADFMEDLGENFAELAVLVREHSYEIELALRVVFKVLSGLVEVVEFLTEAWIFMVRQTNNAIDILINVGLIPLTEMMLSSFGLMLEGAEKAFGWMPGVGDKLKGASEAFDQFKEDTMASLHKMGEAAANANERLDDLNRTRVLKAEIKTWNAKLEEAKAKLKSVPEKKKAKVAAEVAEAIRKLKAIKAELAAIKNKHVTVTTTYNSQVHGRTSKQMGRAMGGVIGSAQTGGVRSNMTLVGEAGPELVNLPPGSHVRSNPDTRRLSREQVPAQAQFVFKSSGRRADDLLLELLRDAIHQRGGDPVAVLGG